MDVQEKIKEKLLMEMYGNIDTIYDFMEQRFALSKEDHDLLIRELNKLKDQLYLIAKQSKLS